MILSRIWYLVLALLASACLYLVQLSVGQYNRQGREAVEEALKGDAQVVSWAMQIDARRRLDSLLLASVDAGVVKSLKLAGGKDNVPPNARDEGAKALRAFNEKLPPDYKSDAVLLADRDGRLVAQVGYDAVNAFPQFEVGGYAGVFDALHGYLRDDTWVLGGRIARVVMRPVEDEVGQPPLGAVVALRWIDGNFAKELAKRTRTNLAFFADGQKVASAATHDGFDEAVLETVAGELATVGEDKTWKDNGRSDARVVGAKHEGSAIFLRLPGDAWELGAGAAVVRARADLPNAAAFISHADDKDKASVSFVLVGAVLVLGAALGLVLSFLEHTRPLKEMQDQAAKLRQGGFDRLQLTRFRGGLRAVAQDVNGGIERILEKGGGSAKPADLESILGPVPAQPAMSAFSLPQPGGPTPAPVSAPSAPAPFPPSGPGLPGSFPKAAASAPGLPPAPGGPRPPPPKPGPPAKFGPVSSTSQPEVTRIEPSQAVPFPKSGDDATRVGRAPDEVQALAFGNEDAEWRAVFADFVKTKRECGEATEGLTFEKFEGTLKKNRDQLIARHNCKRVRFSVYVKDGRASLKATPVREA